MTTGFGHSISEDPDEMLQIEWVDDGRGDFELSVTGPRVLGDVTMSVEVVALCGMDTLRFPVEPGVLLASETRIVALPGLGDLVQHEWIRYGADLAVRVQLDDLTTGNPLMTASAPERSLIGDGIGLLLVPDAELLELLPAVAVPEGVVITGVGAPISEPLGDTGA